MKSALCFLFIFLLSLSSYSLSVKVDVPGIVCQMCVFGIKKHFKKYVRNPDKDIKIDLDQKKVFIKFKKKYPKIKRLVKKALKDSGYKAGKIKIKN